MENKTVTHLVGATKSKHKAIKSGTTLWEKKTKLKVNSKINDKINKSLYNCIMCHPQVGQSPILLIVLKSTLMVTLDRKLFQNC